MLGLKLSTGILDDILGFGGKADQYLFFEAVCAEFGENVRRRLQLQRQRVAGALDLSRCRLARTIIGNRSRLDDHGSIRKAHKHRIAHLLRGLYRHEFGDSRRSESRGSADQRYTRASANSRFGNGIAHLSTGTIPDETNWIDGLECRPGGDENAFALKILRDSERLQDSFDDLFGLGEPACADHSAGKIATSRLDNANAATAQRVEIPLRGLMLPHVYVHCGRDDHPSRGRQIQGGQKIGGGAVGELGQRVGRCRSHQQGVDRLRHADMLDRRAGVGLRCSVGEHFRDDVLAR